MSSESMTPENHFGGSFGPNEWLVDEMYENYLRDPNSIEESWRQFFSNYKPGAPLPGNAPVSTSLSMPPAPKKGVPPEPKSATRVAPAVAIVTPPAPVAPAATATQEVAATFTLQETVRPAIQNTNLTPADPIAKPAPVINNGDARVEPIRGVSARVVQSMEASLTVPTATSVRAVPAKLLIDNRIVINNHMKRARGGKISFTHLIGFAMIKALRAMPEMNNFYTQLEGKPALAHPTHINLGIAIDLAKPDGSRQLLVPSIKGCETMDFRQFWLAYEEVVKKARGGTLTVEDFAGTTVSLTNPGTIGTVHSVPRLVAGQGMILGVGAMDYPAEFQGASEAT
ncbi:MAG: 2-oxoglutarate dehydrogenase component, partial [Actinomycetota bacterium]